jgi:hypothetical protein
MIISKSHDFGFVHIPKCAGSTIRQQLRELDDLGGRFYHTMTLPELGRINGNHVLLKVLERHFADDLAALREVTSYAILREPQERFISAVAQYLRSNVREPSELSEREILAETGKIMAALRADPDQRVARNTIFYRQADYVYLHGERVIDHLYPMDDLAPLFDRLEARHGLSLERDTVWNPTVTYRIPGSSGGIKRVKDVARRMLPTRAYGSVRDLGVRLLTKRGVAQLDAALLGSAEVREFIATHYAGDIALYRAVRAEAEVA